MDGLYIIKIFVGKIFKDWHARMHGNGRTKVSRVKFAWFSRIVVKLRKHFTPRKVSAMQCNMLYQP